MPRLEIPLSFNALIAPQVSDMIEVEAMMLWPKDKAARDRAIRSATALHVKNVLDYKSINSEEEWKSIAELLQGADPIDNIHSIVRAKDSPFVRGVVAGQIVRMVIGNDIRAKKAEMPIGEAVKALSKIFNGQFRLLPQTIENVVWPVFRPVAHLWAAYLERIFIDQEDPVFPCRGAGMRDLFFKAEVFRGVGERLTLHRSPTPLLRSHETTRFPAYIEAELAPDVARLID